MIRFTYQKLHLNLISIAVRRQTVKVKRLFLPPCDERRSTNKTPFFQQSLLPVTREMVYIDSFVIGQE